jgi:hypothetical protein
MALVHDDDLIYVDDGVCNVLKNHAPSVIVLVTRNSPARSVDRSPPEIQAAYMASRVW